MNQSVFEQVLRRLAFGASRGWVPAEQFDNLRGPTAALRQARDSMSVAGAFGTWQSGANAERLRFVPLLFIANAKDAEDARQRVHCRVWSQGLVPILVVCTPDFVYVSEGFRFSLEEATWRSSITQIPVTSLELSVESESRLDALDRYGGTALLSSLAWRDFSIDPQSRVDRQLLGALSALARRLSVTSGAEAADVNALIGRFLYFYMLLDRGFITPAWLTKFNATTCFDKREQPLTKDVVWPVFDELDRLLNGTIFPLSRNQRSQFSDQDLMLLRDCIKLGDTLTADGIQLSFLSFSLASLQTETLSAIYEQFLELEDESGKRRDGVFYTPPFLADFVLDRVEDETPFSSDLRVIDCTAGSGVFVVGAYRRIIENQLAAAATKMLSAEKLRSLLTDSIFAVEKNASAHAVTTFSLYLTMLDYVDPIEISACLEGKSKEQLFPPLGEENIVCRDLFTLKAPDISALRFHVILGNPPWQSIKAITDKEEELTELLGHKVDSSEAAEFAVWWTLEHFAEPDGIVALVLPTKSLVGPSAKKFPLNIARDVEVIGVANLSHLRYKLFANARQASSAVLLRNRPPRSDSTAWMYYPTRAHLPGSTRAAPWVLTFDRAQCRTVLQRDLKRSADAWFEQLMLQPIDRYLRDYLSDQTALGKIKTVESLLLQEHMEMRKGGSPSQTGLPADLLWGADKNKKNDIRGAPGVVPVGSLGQSRLFGEVESGLTAPDLEAAAPNFRRRFSGQALLIPRSMVDICYAAVPVAFNSSLNVVCFSEPAQDPNVDVLRVRLLTAIGVFLESSTASYLFALFGRLWILDRTRLERNDLLSMPIPFEGLYDPLVDEFLEGTELQRTALVCKRFNLSDWATKAFEEYVRFRHEFEDAGVPPDFSAKPQTSDFDAYKSALQFAMRPVCTGGRDPRVEILAPDATQRRCVNIWLTPNNAEGTEGASLPAYEAVAEFSDSLCIATDGSYAEVRKPLERFRWTIESGFSDARQLIQKLMEMT